MLQRQLNNTLNLRKHSETRRLLTYPLSRPHSCTRWSAGLPELPLDAQRHRNSTMLAVIFHYFSAIFNI